MTSLRTAHKWAWGGDRYKTYRFLRYVPGKYRNVTKSKRDWRDHKRQYGTLNVGPDRHAPERLDIIKTHVKPYALAYESVLEDSWHAQDWPLFFKLYRTGRQACFILAGVHLAAQRRAVAK